MPNLFSVTVLSIIHEITQPVEKLQGSIIAIITAHAPDQQLCNLCPTPGPGPDYKRTKTVQVGCYHCIFFLYHFHTSLYTPSTLNPEPSTLNPCALQVCN